MTFADPHGSTASIHKRLKIKLKGPHRGLRIESPTTLLKELGLKSPLTFKSIHGFSACQIGLDVIHHFRTYYIFLFFFVILLL